MCCLSLLYSLPILLQEEDKLKSKASVQEQDRAKLDKELAELEKLEKVRNLGCDCVLILCVTVTGGSCEGSCIEG